MENRLRLNRMLLALLLMVDVTHANVVNHMYKKLRPGQNITGTTVTKVIYKSSQECALM